MTKMRKWSRGQSSASRLRTVRAITAASSCAGTMMSKRRRREERGGAGGVSASEVSSSRYRHAAAAGSHRIRKVRCEAAMASGVLPVVPAPEHGELSEVGEGAAEPVRGMVAAERQADQREGRGQRELR